MIRKALVTLAAVLALASCNEPARDWPEPSPALWQVTGPDDQRAWLFGTIHSLPEQVRWRTSAIDQALARSTVLVVEIADLGNAAMASATFDRLATTPGLPPLSRRVAAADRPELAALLDRARLGDGDFASQETWAAALVLANRTRPAGPRQNVDLALIASKKAVTGLETFAGQYGIFDALPPEEQVDLLMAVAREKAGERQIEAWLTGNLAALDREGSGGLLADPELREALQLGRNRAWLDRVTELMASRQRPFVAVGAAHMLGPEGLPALLEARGFTVERVQ